MKTVSSAHFEVVMPSPSAECFRARPGGVGGARHHACFACISLLDTHFWDCVFCDPF